MPSTKKWNVLFIAEENSLLDSNTPMFNQAFNKVDKALNNDETLKYLDTNHYDMIISDISVEA
ncbi:MAG: hypothetical protein Q8J85_01175, partial [Sulfuricurvum sp.]|nr:hypothetical protein [Sulfuricurvum sp.]